MSYINIQDGLSLTTEVLQGINDSATKNNGANILMANMIRRSGILPNLENGEVGDDGTVVLGTPSIGGADNNILTIDLRVSQFNSVFPFLSRSRFVDPGVYVTKLLSSGLDSFSITIDGDLDVVDCVVLANIHRTNIESNVFIVEEGNVLTSESTGDVGFLLRYGSDATPQYIAVTADGSIHPGNISYVVETAGYVGGRYSIKITPQLGVPPPSVGSRVRIAIFSGGTSSRFYLYQNFFTSLSVITTQVGGSKFNISNREFTLDQIKDPNTVYPAGVFPFYHFQVDRNLLNGVTTPIVTANNDLRQYNTVSFQCTPRKSYGTLVGTDTDVSNLTVYTDTLNPQDLTISGSIDFTAITGTLAPGVYRDLTLSSDLLTNSKFNAVTGAAYIPVVAHHEEEIAPTVTSVVNNVTTSIVNPILPSIACLLRIEKRSGAIFRFSVEQTSYVPATVETGSPYKVYLTNTTLTADDFIV